MKKLEDLVPFCIPTKDLTKAQGAVLCEKFLKVGAKIEYMFSKDWDYFGVQDDCMMNVWDSIASYNEKGYEENVTILKYDEIDEFLGLTETPFEEKTPTKYMDPSGDLGESVFEYQDKNKDNDIVIILSYPDGKMAGWSSHSLIEFTDEVKDLYLAYKLYKKVFDQEPELPYGDFCDEADHWLKIVEVTGYKE
jgi:hypothetical protein